MQTEYLHRILLTIPESLADSFGRWYATNIDPNDDTSTWPKRNKHGKGRQLITHRISNGAYTDEQARLIADKIAELSRQQPPDWDAMTTDERIAWVNSSNPNAFKTAGIYPVAADNTGETWPDREEADEAVGVQPITDTGEPGTTIYAVQVWSDRALPAEWTVANGRKTRDFAVSDMIAELTLTGNGTVVLRQGPGNSGWLVMLRVGPPAKVLLWKIAPPTGPRVVAERTFPTGVKPVLKAQANGNTVTVSLDGTPVIRHVDAHNNTKTRHGFLVNSAWQSFSVRQ